MWMIEGNLNFYKVTNENVMNIAEIDFKVYHQNQCGDSREDEQLYFV